MLAFISLLGVKSYVEEMNNRVVKTTKMYGILTWFFIFALLSLLLAPSFRIVYFSIAIIGLSVYLANFFTTLKRRNLAEMIFLLLLAAIIYSHIVPLKAL